VSRDSEDEKEASNRVEEPEILAEPDFSDVTTSPDALKCEMRAPPPAKMAMSSQHAPVANDSCPYEVKTVYDLSPVRMASPSPTKSPAKESKIVHSDEEQAKISMLEANIVALRALLRDSGVSPRDILVSSSNKQKEGRDVEEETDLITTIADDMSEDEKQRQRQQEVEDESRRVFDLIDLNKDGVVTKIELIKGLKSNCLNLPEVLNLPAHIRQEDGSRDNFMSVFHSMDKNNSSDISLSEFVEFCHNVRAHSSSNILPMIKESNGSESDPEEDADVSALKEAAGQAMQSTVDMLKKVMEDSDLFPTPDKVNAPVISSPKRPSTPDSVGDSRPGSNISPARSRVLTPMPSIGADVDQLSSFKTLATKLNILASYLLTESRASSLRDISDQINNMISEIEDDGDDDLEWGGVIGEEDKVAQLTVSCRKWKVDALSIVRGEIHALEERVSQIYTVFLE
jgi:Ca2+-binding EF-hand superfamily protein